MNNDWKYLLKFVGVLLMVEGALMLCCLIPALHFADGTWPEITASGLFTFFVGLLLRISFAHLKGINDKRLSYLLVVVIWVILALFGTLPFLATGAVHHLYDAFFESMSGVSSTGATIFPSVENLPSSILLWRSMTQWFGGFGIVLLVLALVPSLGINKYSLYTAEASGADNTSKATVSMATTVRQMLGMYITLTLVFILILYRHGMHVWDAVNVTFTNISSGGFSIYNNSLAGLTVTQQYIVGLEMMFSGVNFMLLYNLFTIRWDRLKHKTDQMLFYLGVWLAASLFVICALHFRMDYGWGDAVRCGAVQTISVLTTSGSLVDDTSMWWTPILFLFVILSLCGGMAGSTTGGLKAMRVLILGRNVRTMLLNRLHPYAVNPVRLNGKPVSNRIITNVMVIFLIYVSTLMVSTLVLLLCGINATESVGAATACITGYGPGLGISGGFGCYAAFTPAAKWVCTFIMLMGRLECLTLLVVFVPAFWRK